jgi:beta-glucosidase
VRIPFAATVVSTAFTAAVLCQAPAAERPPYRDARLPIAERVRDLLGRMTLEEKFWQLFMIPGDLDDPAHDYSKGIFGLQISSSGTARAHAERINAIQKYFVEKTRLGIPIIPFEEAVHGLAQPGATMFPQAIALAATWDASMMSRVAGAIARETRSRGIRQVLWSISLTTCAGDAWRKPTGRTRTCRR